MRIFREVSLADSISVLNALFGFSALIYAIYDYEKSFAFFYFALISDGLDGWIAEKTEKSRLGKELDALADCVSFSVYPAFLVSLVNPDLFFLSSLMLSFAILRLARFNVLNLRDFLGIPTSVNAIMVTSLVRLKASQEVLAILMLIFSILMISDLEYKRIRGASLIFFGVLLILAVFFIEVCYLLIAISLIYAALPGVSVCGRYLLRSRQV